MGNGGKESEGSRSRHWRERPVSLHASQEPAGAIEAKGRVECEKAGKPRGLEGKAGWGRGRGRPRQRDPGEFPGSSLCGHC